MTSAANAKAASSSATSSSSSKTMAIRSPNARMELVVQMTEVTLMVLQLGS